MTGGTALNCVANMRLLGQFDASWYARNLGMTDAALRLWVPPVPGDAGVAIGAAYHFAVLAGRKPANPCSTRSTAACRRRRMRSKAAIAKTPEIAHHHLGNILAKSECQRLADLLAFIVSKDGIVGICQGAAETGPRASGRSLDPREPGESEDAGEAQQVGQVSRTDTAAGADDYARGGEEVVQPVTGAGDDDFNAYNYMVLTCRAKPEAYNAIPA